MLSEGSELLVDQKTPSEKIKRQLVYYDNKRVYIKVSIRETV